MNLPWVKRKQERLDALAVAAARRQSPAKDIWRRLLRNKSSVVSLAFLAIIIILAVTANLLFDQGLVTA